VLELAVQGAPVGGARGGRRGGGPGPGGGEPAAPAVIPNQDVAQVGANWPTGIAGARLSPAMLQAQQKWAITPVAGAGGYPGSPYFRISILGTERSLAATAERELVVVPAFTGAPEQLWRFDQLADGSYRVMPKAVPGSSEALALSAVGSSMPTLAKFDPASDRQRWQVLVP
jgi:arabinan endo-1,5-alpha-L-arabinosidase